MKITLDTLTNGKPLVRMNKEDMTKVESSKVVSLAEAYLNVIPSKGQ